MNVNKHLESLCRSTRDFIVGQSVTFMQTETTATLPGQQAKLKSITKSGMSGKSCVYPLICSSATIGVFRNVIAVKPITGVDGKPTHIVTLQNRARNDEEVSSLTSLLTRVMDAVERAHSDIDLLCA